MQKQKGYLIAGIDVGFARTGVGFVEISNGVPKYVHCETIDIPSEISVPLEKPVGRKKIEKRKLSDGERLNILQENLVRLFNFWLPDYVAKEEPMFNGQHRNNALKVGQGYGVINLVLFQQRIRNKKYAPTEVKKYVAGDGRATKDEGVLPAVKSILGLSNAEICEIKNRIGYGYDDAIDGLAIALCHWIVSQNNGIDLAA